MKHRVTRSIRLSVALLTGLMVACISFLIVEFVTLVSVRQSAKDGAELKTWFVDRTIDDVSSSFQREIEQLTRRVASLAQASEFSEYLLATGAREWFTSQVIPGMANHHPDLIGALVVKEDFAQVAQFGVLPRFLVDRDERIKVLARVRDGEVMSGIEFIDGKPATVTAVPVSSLLNPGKIAGVFVVAQEISPRWIERLQQQINGTISIVGRSEISRSFDRERSEAEMRVFARRGDLLEMRMLIRGLLPGGSGIARVQVDTRGRGLFDGGVGERLVSFLPRALAISLLLGLLVGTVIYISVTVPLQRMLRIRGGKGDSIRGAHGIHELAAVEQILSKEQSVRVGRDRIGDTLLASIREGFQLISSRRATLDVNPGLCALVGASRDRFSESSDPFWYLDNEGRAIAQEFIDVLSHDTFISRAGFDAVVRRPDGTERPVGVRLSVVETDDADRCFAVLVIDRSEEKAQQDESARQEQARVLGEFAAGLAHNMNNLLTGIIGAVSVLQSPLRKPNPAIEEKLFSSIRSAALQGAALTKELLQISRSAQVRTSRSAVDVCKVAADAILVVEGMEAARGFVFRRMIPDLSILALCESAGLHQVIVNLLSNAIDAMESPGVIEVAVRPGVGPHAGTIEVEVTDEGSGMSEEVRKRIFEPFFTTKSASAAAQSRKRLGGSGLGLSSSLALVESWGGSMECVSFEGRGSSFYVRIVAADRVSDTASGTTATELRRSSGAWMGS